MTRDAPQILLVDDDVDTCHNMADILADRGYRVDVAYDGPSALVLARRTPYDVALLDMKMPGMNGLMLYHEIKRLHAGTVALLVTAHADGPTFAAALAAGVWRVIPKPVDVPGLLSALDQLAKAPG